MSPRWWPDGDNHGDRIPLSALEHHAYCRRQAALIHVESIFTDDVQTTRGNHAHRHVHEPARPLPPPPSGVRRVTGMPVWSEKLGLYGICDVVELTTTTAVPVEHKIGPYVQGGPADIQVAAQALCLAEMTDSRVPSGFVYSYADRHRHEVRISAQIVAAVTRTVADLREILHAERLPAAVNDRRCARCSMRHDCLPTLTSSPTVAVRDMFATRPLGAWDD
jgi:CRISPR-associated exonuclease Cas4